ncbi:MAG: hypothetical protein KH382_02425 [Clostridiales bacterium]|nr:hypothetical protein [Clostridiales bacterium]
MPVTQRNTHSPAFPGITAACPCGQAAGVPARRADTSEALSGTGEGFL